MKRISIFFFLLFLVQINAFSQKNAFESEIIEFEKSDSIRMPKVGSNLFVGSSSIRLWKHLETDFDGFPVLNRGFGGSNLVDLELFVDRIINKYLPAKIFIYSGENDIAAGASAEETFDRFKKVFLKIRVSLPVTPIVFISIKPSIARKDQFQVQKKANQYIKEYLKSESETEFVSVVGKMILRGKPDPSLFIADKLHMNQKGYEIWTKKLKKYLMK